MLRLSRRGTIIRPRRAVWFTSLSTLLSVEINLKTGWEAKRCTATFFEKPRWTFSNRIEVSRQKIGFLLPLRFSDHSLQFWSFSRPQFDSKCYPKHWFVKTWAAKLSEELRCSFSSLTANFNQTKGFLLPLRFSDHSLQFWSFYARIFQPIFLIWFISR